MSAPLIWVILPAVAGIFIFIFMREDRTSAVFGGTVATVLSLAALTLPIDTALLIGSFSFKISASIEILGRSLVFSAADGAMLAIIYALAAIWFFGTEPLGISRRFVSLGFVIIALFIASVAVEPFLFAALFIQIAALLTVSLPTPEQHKPGRGILRFLIYQTLAMPFILFAGWMLTGVEASPGNLRLTLQAGVMLGLGFAFLLAVFPLYSWIPMLAEETQPYALAFLLWALSTFTVILALGFLDRYIWLRTSPQIAYAIQAAGAMVVVTSGFFAMFQKHLGRLMAYAAVLETGLLILALGMVSTDTVETVFLLLIPRGLELALWGLAVSMLRQVSPSLRFTDLQGIARDYPVAASAVIVAHLSTVGFPLLAGFPGRSIIWQQLAGQSIVLSAWVFAGTFGLLVAAIRTLAVFVMAPESKDWTLSENWVQMIMLGLGILAIFVIGVVPQVLQPLIADLPALFAHLGQ